MVPNFVKSVVEAENFEELIGKDRQWLIDHLVEFDKKLDADEINTVFDSLKYAIEVAETVEEACVLSVWFDSWAKSEERKQQMMLKQLTKNPSEILRMFKDED